MINSFLLKILVLLDRASLTFKPQNGDPNYCPAEKIENERTCDGFEVI